jgi:Fur family transcriptional regulator, ferric uptake regulator
MTSRPSKPAPGDQDSPDLIHDAIELIRQQGGRSTTPRRVVLEALLLSPGELRTAEQLLAHIQASYPDFTESTVYRTLALLEDLDLVDHVHLGHGPSHWYLSGALPRWYLTCTSCGDVLVAEADIFAGLVAEVAKRTGFTVDAGHFAVTGTCLSCSNQKAH